MFRYERLFIISSLELLKMFDDRNTGLATGSTLIRRLDEVATQPKVTIGIPVTIVSMVGG